MSLKTKFLLLPLITPQEAFSNSDDPALLHHRKSSEEQGERVFLSRKVRKWTLQSILPLACLDLSYA